VAIDGSGGAGDAKQTQSKNLREDAEHTCLLSMMATTNSVFSLSLRCGLALALAAC
jgi:hypothetical protein